MQPHQAVFLERLQPKRLAVELRAFCRSSTAKPLRASNEMPGVPEAAKIKSPKDARRPHTVRYVAD
jgi:hypothetical protein